MRDGLSAEIDGLAAAGVNADSAIVFLALLSVFIAGGITALALFSLAARKRGRL